MPAAVLAAARRRHARVKRLLAEALVPQGLVVADGRRRRRDERRVRPGRLLRALLVVVDGVVVVVPVGVRCCGRGARRDDGMEGGERRGLRVGGEGTAEERGEEKDGEEKGGSWGWRGSVW